MTQAATEGIIRLGQVKPGMQILDVATGVGDPSIALAKLVGLDGHVQAVDMVDEMLEGAAEEARQQGLTNISFKQANAESLPFPDQSFDLVTCKHAVMLFVDVEAGLREIRRVLKLGARAVFTAQGLPGVLPRQSCITRVFSKYLEASPPAPGTPHPHRFALPGTLSAALREAEFSQVDEESPTLPWYWHGSPEEYWESRRNQGALFPRLVERLAPEQRDVVLAEVVESIREYYDGTQVNFTARIVLASALR
jgi:ubiquinone/menaquinone biosynthesis C-methylase UbiE